jgi:hypothetical protein
VKNEIINNKYIDMFKKNVKKISNIRQSFSIKDDNADNRNTGTNDTIFADKKGLNKYEQIREIVCKKNLVNQPEIENKVKIKSKKKKYINNNI